MRVLVLTSQTPHHTYFVREFLKVIPDVLVVLQNSAVTPPFETYHPFEDIRDDYERRQWFGGLDPRIDGFVQTVSFNDLNSPEAIAYLAKAGADATVVFGTRKLATETILAAGPNLMNLHGGNPEHYRGLDSHLWAIYHRDFANLVTCLHMVNAALDDGRLIGLRSIPLGRGMGLHELRARNTDCALRLTVDTLQELQRTGSVAARVQRQVGRYYSFMPASLKALCVTRFERHCAGLQ